MKLKTLTLLCISLVSTMVNASTVKMSGSGMCHDTNSSHYSRTKSFTPYESMAQCLGAGGKAYSSYKGSAATATKPTASISNGIPEYDRELYKHWVDTDKDCQDARQEVLIAQSVGTVTYTDNQCRLIKGVWNDPYSGERFYEPSKLDIDHIVTLKWAHEHGAYKFSPEKKEQFANDPANLLAVKASLNRQKGAKPPMEWMPPNEAYECQYLLKFERMVKKYGFEMNASELSGFNKLKAKSCSK